MKNISYEIMQKLFEESITKTFNDKYKNVDSVDKAYAHNLLISKPLINFYLSVGLLFITKYLEKISEKEN